MQTLVMGLISALLLLSVPSPCSNVPQTKPLHAVLTFVLWEKSFNKVLC